jgi:hypothetical protein
LLWALEDDKKNAYFWIASIVADGDMGTEAAECTVLIY